MNGQGGLDEFVSFHMAGQLFGVSVKQVQEILPPQPITSVPLSSRVISGLLNLRGQIVTTIDLRARLEIEPRANPSSYLNIIVNEGDELFSIVVDSVGDVITVEQNTFSSAPSTLDKAWRSCCGGVYQLSQGLLVILDIKSVIQIETNKTSNAS